MSTEEIIKKILHTRGATIRIIVGGLLSFVPIINLLSLGYIYRFLLTLKYEGRIELPSWKLTPGLIADTVRASILWLIGFVLPIGLSILLASLISLILPGIASPAAYLVLSFGLLIAPITYVQLLFLHMESNGALFPKKILKRFIPLNALPLHTWLYALTFWGALLLLAPLYGFVLMGGGLLLSTLYLLDLQKIKNQSSS